MASDQGIVAFPVSTLRIMQIIAGAMLLGVTMFIIIALSIGLNGAGNAGLPIVSCVAGGLLLITITLSLILPGTITKSGLRRIVAEPIPAMPKDEDRLAAIRQNVMIVILSLFESVVFCGCIAFIIEHDIFVMAVVGVAYFIMLMNFPTQKGVQSWLDVQLARLAELRQNPTLEFRL